MKKILETDRLFLRQFELNDAQSFFGLNEDTEVIKFTGDSAFNSVETAENFLKSYNHYEQYGFGRWAVILKHDDAFAGWCGLKYTPEKDEVDLGFRFFKKYWNNGYATEVATACIDYGFNQLGLTKIVGRVMNENIASIKVLTRVGMKFEKDYDFHGHEGSCYAIYKNEMKR
ncbi:MAG: GNAT family N-acetyltransferase [Bacteroidia bacterium]